MENEPRTRRIHHGEPWQDGHHVTEQVDRRGEDPTGLKRQAERRQRAALGYVASGELIP